jgi:hypothetical protein
VSLLVCVFKGTGIKSSNFVTVLSGNGIQTKQANAWTGDCPTVPMLGVCQDQSPNIRHALARQVNIDKLVVECQVLGLRKPRFNVDLLSKLEFCGFKKTVKLDPRFDEKVIFSFRRIHLALSNGPRRSNIPTFRVQVNPSYFVDFESLTYFYYFSMPGFNPSLARITTLDVSIDFMEPISSVRKRLQVSGYQRLELKYSREQTLSFFFGNNPLFRLYDKGEELRLGKGWLTRLEIHAKGSELPVRTYSDLPKLSDLSIFKRIKLVDLAAPKKRSKVLSDFLSYYHRRGYEPAHFEFRQSGNFKRDIGRHLKIANIETVDQRVQEGLKGFWGTFNGLGDSIASGN